MTSKAILAAALCAGLTGGCVSLLPEAPTAPRMYSLTAEAQPAFAPAPFVLSIARPTAARSLSGRDIAWRRGAELAFIDGAAWEAAAPELLHTLALDMMDQLRVARAVVRVADGALSDYELRWEILRFEIDESNPGAITARVEIAARLLGSKSREVLASQRFSVLRPVPDRAAGVAATALGAAARQAIAEMAGWAHSGMLR